VTRDRIVSLQILRFAAAAMVVVFHVFAEHLQWRGGLVGAAGVDVFFVLSGMVITLTGPLASPRPSGALFFWRRWSRVAPIYFLISAPLVIAAVMTGQANWPQTAATFLFWPAAGPQIIKPYLQPGWTLCYEMIFYSAVAIFLIGGRLRRNIVILALLIAAITGARLVRETAVTRFLTDSLFLEFGFGVALAANLGQLRKAPLWLGLALLVSAVGVFGLEAVAGAHRMLDFDGARRVAVFGLPAAALVAGACICDRIVSGALARRLSLMGDASYSTYLTHEIVCVIVFSAFASLVVSHPVLVAGIAIAASLSVGALCYAFVERPIMRDLRRVRLPRFALRLKAPITSVGIEPEL
jgi:exopolysaccharide production protein ExoZ